MSIDSLGQHLLRGPNNSFDFKLKLTEDCHTVVCICCHRSILCAYSRKFSRLIKDQDYFDITIKCMPGYLGPMIELIQYMYLRNPKFITHKERVLKLCGTLEMPLQHFTIQRDADPEFTRRNHACQVQLVPNTSSAVLGRDVLKAIEFHGCDVSKSTKPTVPKSQPRRKYNLRKRKR